MIYSDIVCAVLNVDQCTCQPLNLNLFFSFFCTITKNPYCINRALKIVRLNWNYRDFYFECIANIGGPVCFYKK